MAERLIFHYQARKTPVHRIDTRIKIVITFTLTAAMFAVNLSQFGILTGYIAAGCLAARLPFQRYRRELGFFFVLLCIIVLSRWITTGTLFNGLYYGARFMLVIAAGLLLTDTTAPEDLTLALYWFIKPFSFLKPKRIAARFNLTISFLPIIFDAVMEIQEARRSRLDTVWKRPVKRIISFSTQIFTLILQKAEETAFALEARLFDENIVHGSISLHKIDFLVMLITSGVVWGIIILA